MARGLERAEAARYQNPVGTSFPSASSSLAGFLQLGFGFWMWRESAFCRRLRWLHLVYFWPSLFYRQCDSSQLKRPLCIRHRCEQQVLSFAAHDPSVCRNPPKISKSPGVREIIMLCGRFQKGWCQPTTMDSRHTDCQIVGAMTLNSQSAIGSVICWEQP